MFWQILLVLVSFSLQALAQDTELIVLKSRLKNDYKIQGNTQEIANWQAKELKDYFHNQKSDGSWPDIDYSAVNDLTFPPAKHTARMLTLAMSYATSGSSYFNHPEARTKIFRAFDHWVKHDYQSYNWWNNTIGTQMAFQKTMLLLEEHLSLERKRAGLKILDRSKIELTGQNLLWRAETVFARGLLRGNKAEVEEATKAMQKEIFVSNSEGIKSDRSFHQHGALIYSGGYGAKFSNSIARLIKITSGTFAQFAKDKVDLISSYILDGQRWTSRNNKFDYGVVGREIVRKNISAKILGDTCSLMSSAGTTRSAEFQDCAEAVYKNRPNQLSGNKHFWTSDLMSHQRPGFYASVRMYSTRTLNNDAPSNGEGLLSHHLADGSALIMKDGSEFENIFPIWDWRKIPGTTVEQKKLKPAIYEPGNWEGFAHIRYFGASTFVGGVSDGRYGIAVMDFISNKKYESVNAKKSYFFLDEAMVAMGNGIHCQNCEDVATTLDQSYFKGEVSLIPIQGGDFDQAPGTQNYLNLKAVVHNKMAFVFPRPQSVTVKNGYQTGDWFRINQQYDKTVQSAQVFSLWINHGKNPKNESYEYVIFPNMNYEEASRLDLSKKMQLINTQDLQAVSSLSEKLIQAVFYKKGEHRLFKKKIVVSSPILLMLRGQVLTVSDPTQSLKAVQINIDGKDHFITLPAGMEAGKSVSVNLK